MGRREDEAKEARAEANLMTAIPRAVSLHDELVAMVERLVALKVYGHHEECDCSPCEVYRDARALLAELEEQP